MFPDFLKTKFFLALEVIFLAIAVVGFVNITIKKKSVNAEISFLERKAASIREENEQVAQRLKKTTTDSYVEIEARRKLNYSKPGESVFVFYEEPAQTAVNIETKADGTIFALNNPKKWINYFFPH
jgi:cell division protein FtsB